MVRGNGWNSAQELTQLPCVPVIQVTDKLYDYAWNFKAPYRIQNLGIWQQKQLSVLIYDSQFAMLAQYKRNLHKNKQPNE